MTVLRFTCALDFYKSSNMFAESAAAPRAAGPPLATMPVEFNYSWLPVRASDPKIEAVVVEPPTFNNEVIAPEYADQPSQSFHRRSDEPSHSARSQQQQQSREEAPPGVCYQYFYHGSCERSGCPYRHAKPGQQQSQRHSYDDSQQRTVQSYEGSQSQPQYSQSRQGSHSSDAFPQGGYQQQSSREGSGTAYDGASTSAGSPRRSPYPHTTTRFDNHNNDPEYFGADRSYRPRGFQGNKPCFSFQRGGYCKFGSQCAFSHDAEEYSQAR